MNQSLPKLASGDDNRRVLSLRSNISWTVLGNVIYAMCQWGLLSVAAKLGDPSVVGVIGWSLALVSPIMLTSNLELRAFYITQPNPALLSFPDFWIVRLWTSLVGIVVVVLLLWWISPSSVVIGTTLAFSLAKVFDNWIDATSGLFQKFERMKWISGSLILKGVVSLGLFALILFLTGDLIFAVYGFAGASAFVLVFFSYPRLRRLQPELYSESQCQSFHLWPGWNVLRGPSLIAAILPRTVNLSIAAAIVIIIPYVPRLFIGASLDMVAVGVYTALTSLIVAGSTLVSAVSQSILPRLVTLQRTKSTERFVRLLVQTCVLVTALGIGGIVLSIFLGGRILSLLYTSEYADYSKVLVILAVSATISFVGTILDTAVLATTQYSQRVWSNVARLLALVTFSAVLIPVFGLSGAAVSMLVASGIKTLWLIITMSWWLRCQREQALV